ncbi:MAG: helix-turn-helix transcriptional regulator [Firmicutes bacterium]|nr:helix-turn-helix transcriptional regulator [Bacillota bacterium]
MEITLKAARINAGLTQREAAAKIGVSKQSLSAYETGKRFPGPEVIRRIEEVYGVSYSEIRFRPEENRG